MGMWDMREWRPDRADGGAALAHGNGTDAGSVFKGQAALERVDEGKYLSERDGVRGGGTTEGEMRDTPALCRFVRRTAFVPPAGVNIFS
jgi:hypothetical protein